MNKLELAIKVAWTFVGTFYRWGGDDPAGFDCSGLVMEILASVGKVPRYSDYAASNIYYNLREFKVDKPEAGCLIFWGKDIGHITHVEFCIDNEHTIGASGGGSSTTSVEAAIKQNAYVKVRPIRKNYVAIVNPFKN